MYDPKPAQDASTANAAQPAGKGQPSRDAVAAEPSGPRGDNPATAGPGNSGVKSPTPENAQGHLNPSAPEDANTTPGSTTTK